MTIRNVQEVFTAQATLEGAGVHLHRGFGFPQVPRFDPFLLFDDFSSPEPADYLPGFPWHPHRGIETVTYMIDGSVEHKDSMGNGGAITGGSVQWMTAGSGIVHQEMPKGNGGISGFQLWVNLPKTHKMSEPRYQEFKPSDIPETAYTQDASIRILAGDVAGTTGPVEDITAQPLYADINMNANASLEFPVHDGHTVFLYIFEGSLGSTKEQLSYKKGDIVLFERGGDTVRVHTGSHNARYLLVSGKPLNEEIAWHGPIVMNTNEELKTAFAELNEGTFIKNT